MNQIRIAYDQQVILAKGRFSTAWMVASPMSLWLLKTRLAEAVARHGVYSGRARTISTVDGKGQ